MDDVREKEIKEFLNTIFSIGTDKIELYIEALTHSSSGSPNNQRLAFLGDSVLKLIIREHYFREYPDWDRGELTDKSKIVESHEIFALIASNLNIVEYMKFGKTYDNRQKDKDITTIKEEAFEALVGAIYRDQGMQKTKEIILGLLSDEIEHFDPERDYINYIGRLQEFVQIKTLGLPDYDVERIGGPDHEPTFRAIVKIAGEMWGEGSGNSHKAAKMEAAKVALDKLSMYPETLKQL